MIEPTSQYGAQINSSDQILLFFSKIHRSFIITDDGGIDYPTWKNYKFRKQVKIWQISRKEVQN